MTPYKSFPGSSAGKESTCNAEDLGLIPGLGRSPGEVIGYPFQYSGLGGSQTGLSDFHFHMTLYNIPYGSHVYSLSLPPYLSGKHASPFPFSFFFFFAFIHLFILIGG